MNLPQLAATTRPPGLDDLLWDFYIGGYKESIKS